MSVTTTANETGNDSIGSRVRRAVLWRSGSQIAAQLVTWCATLAVSPPPARTPRSASPRAPDTVTPGSPTPMPR